MYLKYIEATYTTQLHFLYTPATQHVSMILMISSKVPFELNNIDLILLCPFPEPYLESNYNFSVYLCPIYLYITYTPALRAIRIYSALIDCSLFRLPC